MRIAFVSLMGGVPWGGSELLWSETALKAIDQGHVCLFSSYAWDQKPQKLAVLEAAGAKSSYRNRYDSRKKLVPNVLSKIRQQFLGRNDFRDVFRFNPDIILVNQGDNFDLAVHHFQFWEEMMKRRVKYVIVSHSHPQFSFVPDLKIYPRAGDIFSKATMTFFISEKQLKTTERILCMKLENSSVTWNPLNLSNFSLLPWFTCEVPTMAVVANLVSGKGVDTLFESIAEPAILDLDWRINIYGDGWGRSYLENLRDFYSLQDRVMFHGYVDQIGKIWQSNHMLLIPSSGEGLPVSLCEAMVCGRPALVTDVGGNTELIEEGITGYIAEAPSARSLRRAMVHALAEFSHWEELGVNAHELIMHRIEPDPAGNLLKILTTQ